MILLVVCSASIAIVDNRIAAEQYSLAVPALSVQPVVLYDSNKSPRFFDPVSYEELEDTSRAVRKIDKTLAEKAAANAFCTEEVSSHGVYVNPNSGCKSYFVCNSLGSWYFECPLGTLFDASVNVCSLKATC
jgi:hypothetical protein